MKKLYYGIIALVLVAGLAAGCTEENEFLNGDNNGNTETAGKLLTKMAIIAEEGAGYQLDLSWNGSRLSMGVLWMMDSDGNYRKVGEVTPSYNESRLESMYLYNQSEHNGVIATCQYLGNRLDKIDIPHNGLCGLEYNADGKLASMMMNDRFITLHWENGNFVRITDPEWREYSFEYDGRYNPLNDVLKSLFANWNASISNPRKITNYDGRVLNINYSYDGDYPVSGFISSNGDVQARVYYKYSDGTGSDIPSPMKNIRKRRVNMFGR